MDFPFWLDSVLATLAAISGVAYVWAANAYMDQPADYERVELSHKQCIVRRLRSWGVTISALCVVAVCSQWGWSSSTALAVIWTVVLYWPVDRRRNRLVMHRMTQENHY